MRHGITSWNETRRLQGHLGSDLTAEGVLLAEITAGALKEVPFDVCYSSPLLRARHTADIMVGDRNIPIIEDERIQEIGFGEWEGKHVDEEHGEISMKMYGTFFRDTYHYVPPTGGETIQEVIARCTAFLREIVANPELQDKTILVSTHGCATRAILHDLYESKDDFWQGGVPMNCAVSIVEAHDGKARLVESDKVYYPKKYFRSFYTASEESSDEQA